jgi:membrane protein YdbS with pleckstrin-like domain
MKQLSPFLQRAFSIIWETPFKLVFLIAFCAYYLARNYPSSYSFSSWGEFAVRVIAVLIAIFVYFKYYYK